jgi:DNA repair exonuclease SbcCD ATPase subunit
MPVDMEYERQADLIPRLKELLRLRDDAVQRGVTQLQMVQAKNEALSANVDQVRAETRTQRHMLLQSPTSTLTALQVEAEVGSLQEALTEANEKLRAGNKNRRTLEKRIAQLEYALAQLKGQEYAIDVATKQNT